MNLGHNGWTARWFVGLRTLIGLYLLIHYVMLIPWAGEVFSSVGMLPEASASPLFGVLPSVLQLSDAPAMAVGVVALGALSGVLLIAGRYPRVAAVVGWYVGACLLARNPLILNPALPHVGWLLLWFSAIRSPSDAQDEHWRLPNELYAAGWVLMGTVMTWSAITKLGSVSWLDGSALHHVWNNPLARDTPLRLWLLDLPSWAVAGLTWGTLAVELVAVFAAFRPGLRPAVWTVLLLMHIGLLLTVDFADLTAGMLVVHFALFDPRWLEALGERWGNFRHTCGTNSYPENRSPCV